MTLYNWLKQCRAQEVPVPGQSRSGDGGSTESNLAVVIEIAPMSKWPDKAELSAALVRQNPRQGIGWG